MSAFPFWWMSLKQTKWSCAFFTRAPCKKRPFAIGRAIVIEARQQAGHGPACTIDGEIPARAATFSLRLSERPPIRLEEPEAYLPMFEGEQVSQLQVPPDYSFGQLIYMPPANGGDHKIEAEIFLGREGFEQIWGLYSSTTRHQPEYWYIDAVGPGLLMRETAGENEWRWNGQEPLILCKTSFRFGKTTAPDAGPAMEASDATPILDAAQA